MKKQSLYLVVLILISCLQFFISNHYLRGYLRSETGLSKEIKTPLDSIHQYRLAEEAPFKYRLLFPFLIKGTYHALYDQADEMGFYYTYKFWSIFFYATSVCAMYWLLLTCGFSSRLSFDGAMIFLLLPAMLLAFTLPVHTREDTLAYTIFFVGLVFFLKDMKWPFLCMGLLGVLCRETLLLLPLLYFFFAADRNLIRRLFIAGLPAVLGFYIRFFSAPEPYDTWEGLRWNLNNPEQVVGFLFIVFNVCWIPFFIQLFYSKNITDSSARVRFFRRSALFILIVILLTTFVGGIFNEIRLLHLFCPWVIVLTMDFIRRNKATMQEIVQTTYYKVFALFSLVFCAMMLVVFLRFQEKIIVPGKFNVPYHLWIIFSFCYIFIVMLFLPLSIKIFSLKKSLK